MADNMDTGAPLRGPSQPANAPSHAVFVALPKAVVIVSAGGAESGSRAPSWRSRWPPPLFTAPHRRQ
ncbi:hypothetical protein HBI23_192450 [Parastagonospora nodorum]|nr:hypothetical protein HBI47_188590 [Parastagonospora nodorum]KAH5643720.1 hypothetical protein HBI23_192450 [Parastagonospora nodorum]